MLPPPESSKSRHSKPLKPPEDANTTSSPTTILSSATTSITRTVTTVSAPKTLGSEDWLTSTASGINISSFEDTPKSRSTSAIESEMTNSTINKDDSLTALEVVSVTNTLTANQYIDAFTDLDPLGTGKSKPYIDKKYFFQDLKNPPKKVLKDLSEQESVFTANFGNSESTSDKRDAQSIDDDLRIFETSNNILESGSNTAGSATVQSTKSEFNNGIKGVDFSPNFPKPEPTTASSIFRIDMEKLKTDDPIIGNNKALLVTDNDPFSPRMKKFDPFDDDFSKSSIHDPFEFSSFSSKGKSTTILPDTKITSEDLPKIHIDKKITDFNGPLQVNLPPEGYTSAYIPQHKRVERHNSDAGDSSSNNSTARTRPSVFKQNTVDVINSISSKKMKPHLFSQKYSKRDSNSINMRRLQESDSLSENETAPEPPPRPDSSSHIEPPPLPPKKQFSDIIIRPRVTSPLATPRESTNNRYDYVDMKLKNQPDGPSPALPLPSRRVQLRNDSNYPGPGRPVKKSNIQRDEDDYLTPISVSRNDLPILLPPPQTKGPNKNRGRRQPEPPTASSTDVPIETAPGSPKPIAKPNYKNIEISLPDITLSQLLTLGIDDMAMKLNVPSHKLSTMNIVELTQYLSDFVEKSSQKSIPMAVTAEPSVQEAAIFKVNFDQSTDATFVAKFDDNFGEDDHSFVPNFANFNADSSPPSSSAQQKSSVDRYAVFREIMEQDLKIGADEDEDEQPNDLTSSFGSEEQNSDIESNEDLPQSQAPPPPPPQAQKKIDTKITQIISQAKDRYAALRDIIMVEDLFDKPNTSISPPDAITQNTTTYLIDSNGEGGPDGGHTTGDSDNQKETEDEKEQSSPEINISINLDDSHFDNDEQQQVARANSVTVEQIGSQTKDDLEINEYMNRAISNLSLDSRDHLSPINRSPVSKMQQHASTSPIRQQQPQQNSLLPSDNLLQQKTTLNNMSTSPIPSLASLKSPVQRSPLSKSPIDTLQTKSPTPHGVLNLVDSHQKQINSTGSMSDIICGSSPEGGDKNLGNLVLNSFKNLSLINKFPDQSQPSESWAVFESVPEPTKLIPSNSPRPGKNC